MALEAQFIDFQSQTLKVKDWLTRAENILTSHSRLSEQQHVLSPHSETIKVSSHVDFLHPCACATPISPRLPELAVILFFYFLQPMPHLDCQRQGQSKYP